MFREPCTPMSPQREIKGSLYSLPFSPDIHRSRRSILSQGDSVNDVYQMRQELILRRRGGRRKISRNEGAVRRWRKIQNPHASKTEARGTPPCPATKGFRPAHDSSERKWGAPGAVSSARCEGLGI